MFKRSSSRLLGSLLCLSLMPAVALAQMEPKGFYATIYGQYSQIGSSSFTESGAQGLGSGLRADFNSGFGLGGDIGYRYGNGWAAEVEWNYRNHSLDTLRQGGGNLARDGDFASNTIFINGLRRFSTDGAWTPYLGAGIGWVEEIDIDITPRGGGTERGYSDGNEFAFQFIAGVEYEFTPQWSLTADTRYMRVGSVRLDNETGNSNGKVGTLKYNPFSVQVGVRYNF
jgi:opacity protein-like surface antigen